MGIKHIGDRTIENWSVDGIHGLLQRLVILQNLLRASGNVIMTLAGDTRYPLLVVSK